MRSSSLLGRLRDVPQPGFSIVIPTYQRRDMVCGTVAALSAMKYKGAVEIVVVIDGSIDGTAQALADVESRYPTRVIEQPNRGQAAARNIGGAAARHQILLFLDDDMRALPGLLREHARSYAAGADAVVGQFIEHGDAQPQALSGDDEVVTTAFGTFTGQLSVKRSVFEKLKGFDESFTANGGYGYEDTDFVYRLVREGFSLHRNRRVLTGHCTDVRPLQLVRRARRCARAERLLIAKHPELTGELYSWTGAGRISNRLRRLAEAPFAPAIVATIAAALAELGLRTPFRSSRRLAVLCDRAYTLAYWSAVHRNGGIPRF